MVGLTDSQKPGSIIQVPKLQPISEAGGPTPVIYSHHLLSASQRGDGSNLQERARTVYCHPAHIQDLWGNLFLIAKATLKQALVGQQLKKSVTRHKRYKML